MIGVWACRCGRSDGPRRACYLDIGFNRFSRMMSIMKSVDGQETTADTLEVKQLACFGAQRIARSRLGFLFLPKCCGFTKMPWAVSDRAVIPRQARISESSGFLLVCYLLTAWYAGPRLYFEGRNVLPLSLPQRLPQSPSSSLLLYFSPFNDQRQGLRSDAYLPHAHTTLGKVYHTNLPGTLPVNVGTARCLQRKRKRKRKFL